MPCVEGIKDFLSKAVVTYTLAALVLVGIADPKRALIDRLNQLVECGYYPGLLRNGSVHFDKRNLRMAIRYYKLVTQLFPQNDGPYAMIGYCYAQLGLNVRAIRYFKQARVKAPNHIWYDYNLGMLYLRGNDRPQAFEFFHKVIGQDIQSSMDASILAPLSKISAQQHQELMAQAIEFSTKIREDAFRMMIKLDFERRRYAQAFAEAETATQDPAIQDKEEFILYAGAGAFGAGNWKNAADFCRLALKINPQGTWERLFFYLSVNHLNGQKVPETGLWEKFLRDTQVFPIQEGYVVLHPWAYYIQPGKEIYL